MLFLEIQMLSKQMTVEVWTVKGMEKGTDEIYYDIIDMLEYDEKQIEFKNKLCCVCAKEVFIGAVNWKNSSSSRTLAQSTNP